MSAEAIKISIIVPIYNVEDYVKPCIESIMRQSYRNLEIILVDDGSTDHCPEICDYYAQIDKRVHVIHKHNGGVTSARKAGVAAATGNYVLCVDGDDWIEEDRVEVLVRDGILPAYADMIFLSGHIMDFEDKESIRQSSDVPTKLFVNDEIENEIFPLLPDMQMWSLCSWAIRKELLLKNQILVDDLVINGEDFLCVVFCLLDAKSAMVIQQGGYHCIYRASSLSHRKRYHLHKDYFKIWYQVLKNRLQQKRASKKICKICNRIAVTFAMSYHHYDYDWLQQKFPNCLFPFPKVKSGTQIVVYGAGKVGRSLVKYLDKTKWCSVVLWVDQNQNLPAIPGYTICSRDSIFSVDYDFVVVAIVKESIAKEVKRSLILDGIPEKKIATMDASAISDDAIPEFIHDTGDHKNGRG